MAANQKNLHSRASQREQVYEIIAAHSPTGISMKEVARLMGKPFHTVVPRGTELKASGLVCKTGEVEDGSAMLRVI